MADNTQNAQKFREYKIVRIDTYALEDDAREVEYLLAKGWELYGYATTAGTQYLYQTLTRRHNDQPL